MEQSKIAVILEGAESAGAVLNHLDLGVESLGYGVGDAVSDVVDTNSLLKI